jgi:clorobiocin biosynthesis protein CloN6
VVLELIDQTEELLDAMERAITLDGGLPAGLRSEIATYNDKIISYSSDQIVPMPRPFGGRWFDDFTAPAELIDRCRTGVPQKT